MMFFHWLDMHLWKWPVGFRSHSKPDWTLSIFWEGASRVQWLSLHTRDSSNQNNTSLFTCYYLVALAKQVNSCRGTQRDKGRSSESQIRTKRKSNQRAYDRLLFNVWNSLLEYHRVQRTKCYFFKSFLPGDSSWQRETYNSMQWKRKWRRSEFCPRVNASNQLTHLKMGWGDLCAWSGGWNRGSHRGFWETRCINTQCSPEHTGRSRAVKEKWGGGHGNSQRKPVYMR